MIRRKILPALVLTLAALWPASTIRAATIHHTDLADFIGGLSDGIAVPMMETSTPAEGPASGGVGLLPGLGAAIIQDDFSYADLSAAQAAGWRFLLLNEQPAEASTISFTGQAARMRVSKPHDLLDPNSTRSPVLLAHNQPINGDFIVETKVTVPDGRVDERTAGVFISEHTGDSDVPVQIDGETRYVYAAMHRLDALNTVAVVHPGAISNYSGASFPGDTIWIRVVKRGAYFYSYFRNAEDGPWVFSQWVKAPGLVGKPLVVAAMGKSFGSVTPETQFQNVDFDYLRVNAVGTNTGAYSNVMDGGPNANWQTVSLQTHSMQGVRYQLRTGNTLVNGTLTDAGPFAGPDGTSNSAFEDDAAQVVPHGENKRYLEYNLLLDQSAENLPAFVTRFSAVVQPAGVGSGFASNGAEFGANAGDLDVQPGGGDLGLRRTTVFQDDFTSSVLESNWVFDPGYAFHDPNAVGDYSLTARPGYLRMLVGYPQDFDTGSNELGGVKLLRSLPTQGGLPITDFEVETEVTMEVQPGRQAVLWLYENNDNNVGISVLRRNTTTWEVGFLEQLVLNNGTPTRTTLNYGSNTVQMRVTKRGQIVTMAVRDAASPSPSWRVVRVRDLSGTGTLGADFSPWQVGLMGKSFSGADRGVVASDFNYFRISTLAPTGTRDLAIQTAPGSRLDSVVALGDALTARNARVQVSNGSTFVGPDGTSSTHFTTNEPKVPAALANITSPQVRVTLDDTTPDGSPYLHALGLQYAYGETRIVRDTNRADFAAGTGLNIDIDTTPGLLVNAGGATMGTPRTDNFSYTTNDPEQLPWVFNNPTNPNGQSAYSFTDVPGFLRLKINTREDIGTAARRRAFMHHEDPLDGDWEIESHIAFPNGRESGRITGIGVYQDNNNLILLGTLNTDQLAVRSFNNSGSIIRDTSGNFKGSDAFYLRIRKAGQVFTSYAKSDDGFSEWEELWTRTYNGIVNPVVGLMAHSSSPASTPEWPVDYDYFTITPLDFGASFESRALDLGVTGLAPVLSVAGANVSQIQLQFRAADSEAGLAAQPFTGPDGTAASHFTGDYSGALPASLHGKRYYQYRAVLPVGAGLNDLTLIGLPATTIPLTRADAIHALRIAGGLTPAAPADLDRLDLAGGPSADKVDLVDVLAILRETSN